MTDPLSALKAGPRDSFWFTSMPRCPHCGEDFSISENEAWRLYDENGPHEVDCPSCELPFQVSSSATWYFSTDDQED